MHAVVEARNVHSLCETRLQSVLGTIHALRDGTRGVEAVTDVLQVACHVGAALHALLGNLVADAPHHDGGMVAVGQDEVLYVAVAPLLEEAGVAVLALGIDPHIERLCHDHHAKGVANLHLHLTGHIVSRTDGVAAHGLHRLNLTDKRRLVDGSTQRTEVVVQTDALQLAGLAIELETAFLGDADGADAYFFLDFIDGFAIFHQLDAQAVEVGLLGRP